MTDSLTRDSSQQPEPQQTLEREEYFRALLENASDIITVINRDGTRRYVSPSVERILGYQPEELIGKTPLEILHPDDAAIVRKLYLDCLAHPDVTMAKEVRLCHKDGSWRFHEATAHNLLHEPAVAAIVINSRDVTDRKRAEAALEQIVEQEKKARQEAETAVDRIRSVQRVTDVGLAHLSLDELLAESLDRIHDALRVDTVAILLVEGNELVAWATKNLELDLGIRVPMGAGFAGRVAEQKSAVVIDDSEKAEMYTPFLRERGVKSLVGVPLLVEGRVIGVIHVGKFTPYHFSEDDTRLLQLVADRIALAIDNARLFEEERSARREAEAASRAKDEFLTTISHELRTPLTPVIGWLHMIRSGILPESEMQHGLSVIEKNTEALKRLINDLLDMSAILSGKMRMEDAPIHLEDVVREALETVRPLADARAVHLDIEFHDWQNEIVTGDRARLVQVFWNLLHNAIKFSPSGGRVRVDCEASGRTAVVCVEDFGQGITAEFLPFVFERFRQADGSKTRSHGGLGLGLSLVKSFVEAHRGTIEAQSEGPGRGSRFTVRLPRRTTAGLAAPGEADKNMPEKAAPSIHLMIVDDDEDTLEILRTTFEKRGFRVTTCDSSAEALRLAQENSFDLIISDIGMPGMDGFEMIRRARQTKRIRHTPAIALSGYASQKDSKASIAAGFNAHVAKPVDPKELTALIDSLLRQNRSGEQS